MSEVSETSLQVENDAEGRGINISIPMVVMKLRSSCFSVGTYPRCAGLRVGE